MWLDLTTSLGQTWLFSSTSTYHSTDLLTARGVAHLVVHGTSGSTSYETIPPVRLETSGGMLSTVDLVMQRRDGPRRLRELDDDDDDKGRSGPPSNTSLLCPCKSAPRRHVDLFSHFCTAPRLPNTSISSHSSFFFISSTWSCMQTKHHTTS